MVLLVSQRVSPWRWAALGALLIGLLVATPYARADDEVGEFVSLNGHASSARFTYKVFKDSQGSYYLKGSGDNYVKPQEGQNIVYRKPDGTMETKRQPNENNRALNLQLRQQDDLLIATLFTRPSITEVNAGDRIFSLSLPFSLDDAYATLNPPLFGDSGPIRAHTFFDVFTELDLDGLESLFVLGSSTADGATPGLFHFNLQETFTFDPGWVTVIVDPAAPAPSANERGVILFAVPEPGTLSLIALALLAGAARHARKAGRHNPSDHLNGRQ